jgi:hypothetical protein
MTLTPARSQFLQMLARPDDRIDLPVAALLIAKEEYPELDVPACLSRLDRLAQGVRSCLPGPTDNPFVVLDALNTHLFEQEGFRGNQEDYFDPRNSFLNDVLERRLGIPITLSIIYVEVAARIGFCTASASRGMSWSSTRERGERSWWTRSTAAPSSCRRTAAPACARPTATRSPWRAGSSAPWVRARSCSAC